MQANMAMIRHTRWFEEHANQSSVRILIKVLKDIKRRYEGFKALDVWSLELLVSCPTNSIFHSSRSH